MCVLEGRRRSQVVSEPTTPTGSSNSKKENYIMIVDERKIKVRKYILYRVHQCHSCVYNTCTLLYVMRELHVKLVQITHKYRHPMIISTHLGC